MRIERLGDLGAAADVLRALAHAADRRSLPPPAALIGDWFGSAAVIAPSVDIRPVDPAVRAGFADKFPAPEKLWTIEDLGGWETVDAQLFRKDSGSITKIYQQPAG